METKFLSNHPDLVENFQRLSLVLWSPEYLLSLGLKFDHVASFEPRVLLA